MNSESLSKLQKDKRGGLLQVNIPIKSKVMSSIAGEGGVGLNLSGSHRIIFSGRSQWDNRTQTTTYQQSKFPSLQMEQISQFEIKGTIGTKISVSVSQNSKVNTPLANRLIIRYKGDEDDVIKSIEAGNTTLSLPNTQFVGYSSRIKGLFGLKAEAQIGGLNLTAIASQEKGTTERTTIEAGASIGKTNIIRDYQYDNGRIFDLGRASDFDPGDVIGEIVVYRSINTTNTNDVGIQASMYVDPDNLTVGVDEEVGGQVEEILDGYYPNINEHWLMFTNKAAHLNANVGVYMKIIKSSGDTVEVGDISGDTLKLKLIKLRNPDPSYITWDYMWQNVYSLSYAFNDGILDLDGLEINILKGAPGTEDDTDNLDYQDDNNDIRYIQLFGLDRLNQAGDSIPDNLVDIYSPIIEPEYGLLIFPEREPFNKKTATVNTKIVNINNQVPEIYNNTYSHTDAQINSTFYITYTTKTRSTEVRLGKTNIIENSERVLLNGKQLEKGVDYRITYGTGSLTFLTEEATDPNANISIDFEYTPFFVIQKKSLFGIRGEYEFSNDLKLGATLLYKSDKATDRKPKIGQETSNMLVWDSDISFRVKPEFLTAFANAIPFFTTEAVSNLAVSAEIAQSIPNPNIDGVAYIDDFEGSRESYSLGIFRENWVISSRPVSLSNNNLRARMIWYNPFEQTPTRDIWNREIAAGEGLSHTLKLEFKPAVLDRRMKLIEPVPTQIDDSTASWAGIMRYLQAGSANQENAKLFEIRVKGDKGIVHFDFGRIAEDLNGDGVENTEDIINPDFNIYDEGEDIGLDGLDDIAEQEYYQIFNVDDPAGDNFYYDANVNYSNYENINGTQGNASDAGSLGKPDEENINRTDGFETVNSYFSYAVDLSDEFSDRSYFVEGSKDPDTDWKSYRIPLLDSSSLEIVGSPLWSQISFVRIWVESPDGTPVTVNIAAMDLISSNWEDTLIPLYQEIPGLPPILNDNAQFNVAVINTQENIDYISPPGVEGYDNPVTGVREPEQSLLMHYSNFTCYTTGDTTISDTGIVEKKLLETINMLGYNNLKMYVHGPSVVGNEDNDSILFFFRAGTDAKNYYEYREILTSDWHDININFTDITGFKEYVIRAADSAGSTIIDSTEGNYRIFGRPNIKKVQYIAAGVTNLDPADTVSGDIWLNELQVTEVRDDVGLAARLTVSGNVADLFSYNANYNYMNSYFRKISESTKGGGADNLGSGKSTTSYGFGISFSLDKFMPRSLGAKLPVNMRYSKSTDRPLLQYNSDIILPEELRDEESSINKSKSFSISESVSKKTKNPLFTILLNNIRTNFSYSRNDSKSPATPMSLSENISSNMSYGFTIAKVPSLKPFFWTKPIPLLNKLQENKFYLIPKSLNTSGKYSRNFRVQRNSSDVLSTNMKRDFTGSFRLGYKMSDNIEMNYSMDTRRDLSDLETVVFSFNPKKFKLGKETSYNQAFGTTYNPILFNFLTHKFIFSTSYRETFNVSNDTRQVTSSKSYGIGGSFNHKQLFGADKKSSRVAQQRRRNKDESNVTVIEKKTNIIARLLKPPKKVLAFLTGWIEPFSYDYKEAYSYSFVGLRERATFGFRFGLTDDPGALVDSSATSIGTRNSIGKSTSYSLRSGTTLLGGLKTDVSFARSIREDIKKETNPQKSVSTTFPDINFSIRQFTTFKFLNPLIKVFSPRTKYSRSKAQSIDLTTGFVTSEKITTTQSPFLSFNFAIMRGMDINFTNSKTITEDKRFNKVDGSIQTYSKSTANNTSISTKYSFNWPGGFKIPIFGRLRIRSTMSIALDIDLRKQKPEQLIDGKLESKGERTDFQITPTIQYSFSSQIKGSISGRWQDTNDKQQQKKSHVREIRITVDIRF
ncbi:MAG: cell surface protein SprA [Candidatus Zixiibacteriota bacterium]